MEEFENLTKQDVSAVKTISLTEETEKRVLTYINKKNKNKQQRSAAKEHMSTTLPTVIFLVCTILYGLLMMTKGLDSEFLENLLPPNDSIISGIAKFVFWSMTAINLTHRILILFLAKIDHDNSTLSITTIRSVVYNSNTIIDLAFYACISFVYIGFIVTGSWVALILYSIIWRIFHVVERNTKTLLLLSIQDINNNYHWRMRQLQN